MQYRMRLVSLALVAWLAACGDGGPARVKVVVVHFMQPVAVYRDSN